MVSNAVRHCSSVISETGPGGGPPTEINPPSRRPNAETANSTSRSGVAGSARSATTPTARSAPPSRSVAAFTRAWSREESTTRAPSATSASAVAYPSSREAPVNT